MVKHHIITNTEMIYLIFTSASAYTRWLFLMKYVEATSNVERYFT